MRLAAEVDFLVVGETMDCEAALSMVQGVHPDVVIVDLESPRKEDPIETARSLRTICDEAPVVLLSMHADALGRLRAEQAGAAAFVAKFLPVEVLLTTIRGVVGGYGPARLVLETRS